MLLLKGTRTARIKTYTDHDHQCNDCKDFDLKVKVYKQYFHFFFIPIFAEGIKTVKIRCNKCDEPYRSDSLQKQYENRTRTPFWLYTGVLVVGLAVLGGVGAGLLNGYLNGRYVANPQPGDVYEVKHPNTFIEFYKVVRINGDSIVTYNNNVQYVFSTSALDSTDYFVSAREVLFSKNELGGMLDSGIITDVSRHYGESSGFNRLK